MTAALWPWGFCPTGLDGFEVEIEDRFGALPEEARRLLNLARVRLLVHDIGIVRIDAGPAALALTPRTGVTVLTVETRSRVADASSSPNGSRRRTSAWSVRSLLEEMANAQSD